MILSPRKLCKTQEVVQGPWSRAVSLIGRRFSLDLTGWFEDSVKESQQSVTPMSAHSKCSISCH